MISGCSPAPLSCVPHAVYVRLSLPSPDSPHGLCLLLCRQSLAICAAPLGAFVCALFPACSLHAVPYHCSITAYLCFFPSASTTLPARLCCRCQRFCCCPLPPPVASLVAPSTSLVLPHCSAAPTPAVPWAPAATRPPRSPLPRPRPPISPIRTKMPAIRRAGVEHTGQ